MLSWCHGQCPSHPWLLEESEKSEKSEDFPPRNPVAQLKQRSICKELQSSQLRRRILACTGRQILAPKTARLNQTGSKSSDHLRSKKNKITSGPKQITSSNMPMDFISQISQFMDSPTETSSWADFPWFSQPCLVDHPEKGQVARGAFDGI